MYFSLNIRFSFHIISSLASHLLSAAIHYVGAAVENVAVIVVVQYMLFILDFWFKINMARWMSSTYFNAMSIV